MKQFGLIGHPLSHSFSPGYFSRKFRREGLNDCRYDPFDLPQITDFPKLLERYPDLLGLNVTIPHKTDIIPFLDEISPVAREVGAVNTIDFAGGRMVGYNTDVVGFEKSLMSFLDGETPQRALVLGTGGAAKAVWYVLDRLDIPFIRVSRDPGPGEIGYGVIDKQVMEEHRLIINTTPLGQYPNFSEKPEIPYSFLTEEHFLFDLIYNPEETAFLQEGKKHGAITTNGLQMLILQAEASWELWDN
ncbi:MAG: shikimate dehydrogenase [Bacteroidota bacterium]|nr:shikimate dehydrogenase [Bacteroidota bacterium]MDX5427648.1 shikimate dehydrogenase [Bacteroidota bacterium]MDX5505556.1 shikimate dehydrogenase [Bacteroidota bacterium]